jgi:two-component system, cell cycle sensor histidine kinase and response regulator CckA
MQHQDSAANHNPASSATVPIDDLLDCLWRLDMDLQITFASPRTDALLGIPAAALIGSPLADHTNRAELAQFRELVAGLLAESDRTRSFLHELRLRHADGSLVPCELHGRLVLDRTGEPMGMLISLRNITDRQRLDLQTRHAEMQRFELQKLGAIAQLAGGVVGDLQALLDALDLCPETEEHPELAPLRAQAAQRIAQLRALAGQLDLERRDLDVDALVGTLVAELQPDLPGNVTLVHRRRSGGSTVWADRELLSDVLRNLCLNARDAMPTGGVITIATSLREAAPAADGPPTAAPRPWVEIAVSDTGEGLDHATRERILEPFFTTKTGGGGLSLPLAHGIIGQHGGRLDVESELGQGSTFRVSLPARFAGYGLDAGNDEAGGRPTVLLVDDDPEILRYCGKILHSGGYAVVACGDGAEALAYIAGDDPVDLVLLDWALPGLDGRRVREQLARHHPDLPLLIISGHLRAEYEALGGIDHETPWLVKPFTPAALLAAVGALLPGRVGGS